MLRYKIEEIAKSKVKIKLNGKGRCGRREKIYIYKFTFH